MTKRNQEKCDADFFFLLEHGTYDWYVLRLAYQGKVGKEGLCICGCFKGPWDFNEDIKSLL